MLNQKNEDPIPADPVSPELEMLQGMDLGPLLAFIEQATSPSLQDTPALSTSPVFSEFDDFESPLIAENDFLTEGLMNEPLFPPMPDFDQAESTSPLINYSSNIYGQPTEKKQPPSFSLLADPNLYILTPETPMLHDFGPSIDPASLHRSPALLVGPSSFPSPAIKPPPESPLMAPPMTRRKSSATGTRKGLTTEALVPIDAPTQPRKYLTPSVTSRKDLPATFARKRARSTAFGEEDDDQLEPLGPNATELEQIEYKRRQNTIAARRSRARKLLHQQELEASIDLLEKEKDAWKERALMCQQMLVAHGIPAPSFEE